MVADQNAATAPVETKSGNGLLSGADRAPAPAALLGAIAGRCRALPLLALLLAAPAGAASNKVRISNLTDVAFGSIANLNVDAVRSESLCLFADTNTNGYNVTATGTGPGGAFQLTSGVQSLAYEVQWSSSSGQTSGAQLSPNVPLTGQISSATHQACSNGPSSSASLVLILRSSALSSASAGTYNGTLTLLVGPE